MQALEGLTLAEKVPTGGRRLTSQVRCDLDCLAAQIKLADVEKAANVAPSTLGGGLTGVDLSDAKVAQVVADGEPGVDLSAAEDVEVNKNTTKSSTCECFGNH